jgi:hypothetical protein
VITGSVLLAAVAAVFLGLGLVAGSNADTYFYCSIVGSVLAGFALFAGLRYRLVGQLQDDDFDGPVPSDRPSPGDRRSPGWRGVVRPIRGRAIPVRPDRVTGRAAVPVAPEPDGADGSDDVGREEPGWEERDREQSAWDGAGWGEGDDGWDEGAAVSTRWADDDDPDVSLPDEPSEQELTAAVAARVAKLDAEVVVIDGRPRYHVEGCLHLLGRSTHRLSVVDVVALGFTPCGDCEPATALLDTSAS